MCRDMAAALTAESAKGRSNWAVHRCYSSGLSNLAQGQNCQLGDCIITQRVNTTRKYNEYMVASYPHTHREPGYEAIKYG